MNRSRKRRKRLGLPPYGTNVVGVDVPNKMQCRRGGYPEWRSKPILLPECVVSAEALIKRLNVELEANGYQLRLERYEPPDNSYAGYGW